MRALLAALLLIATQAHAQLVMVTTRTPDIPADWASTGVDTHNRTLTGVTSGNGILCGVLLLHATATITSLSMENESNLTPVGSLYVGSAIAGAVPRIQYFYLPATTATEDKDLSLLTSAAVDSIYWCAEFVGEIEIDADGLGAEGTGTALTDGVTTTVANATVFVFGYNDSEDPGPGSGYTEFELANPTWYGTGAFDLDVGAANPQTPGMATVGSVNWAVRSISIAAAGGAPPGLVVNPISGKGGGAAQPTQSLRQ